MTYIKELDALRAMAILCVLANHWYPVGSTLNHVSDCIDAPNIFFAISGFLVTKILLNDRLKAEKNGLSYQSIYRRFFLKRVLRLFPAYYLTILLTYLLKPDSLTPMGYLSCLTFTPNFYIYIQRDWGNLGHLWTMGVEQQFYLVWPLLILLVSKRYVAISICVLILVGILSQWAYAPDDFSQILPYTVLDTLGLGALLAWLITYRLEWLARLHKPLLLVGALGVIVILCEVAGLIDKQINNKTITAFITVAMIAHFIMVGSGPSYPLSFFFRNKSVLFIGKISYGIYLYHGMLYANAHKFLNPVNALLPPVIGNTRSIYAAECLVLLIGLAWLSWVYIEQPVSGLKRYVAAKPMTFV